MAWYSIDAVDRAFSRTKKLLLEPFDFWKWARLALIVFLLNGLSAGSGNGGGSYQGGPGNFEDVFSDLGLGNGPEALSDLEPGDFSGLIEEISPYFDLIVLGIIILLLIGLLFAYLSNVMEFVFVESLVSNEVKVLDYTKRFLGHGFRLFIIRIVLGLIFLLALGAALFPFISRAIEGGFDFDSDWQLLLGGIFWFLGVLFVLGLISSVIGSFLNLAIPLSMYRKSGILSAFGLVFKNFRQSWKEVLVYWVARVLLRLGIAIAAMFLFLLVMFVLGLAFLLVDGILYFLLSALTSGDLVWLGLAPVLFIEFLLFLGAMLFLNVPIMVFLKYHMLSFLEMWYPGAEIPFFDRKALA